MFVYSYNLLLISDLSCIYFKLALAGLHLICDNVNIVLRYLELILIRSVNNLRALIIIMNELIQNTNLPKITDYI